MKTIRTVSILFFLLISTSTITFAQDVQSLVREGRDMSNQKNYAGAIEKYKAALAIDPKYAAGNYQMAFTLNAMGKGMDAIPYLEKIFQSDASANLLGGAYDLAGSIYDRNHQAQKAVETYQAGIKANPTYQPLHYNLGLVYSRNHQYAEAEQSAISAIKLDPKHASSMRLYALVTFHQNKRAEALLGFCSFTLLEPNTARSAEAYGNIQHILQGGVLKPEPGQMASHAMSASTYAENELITKAIAPFAKRRYASAGDLLTAQLSAIFNALGTMPHDKTYYWQAMADYFYKLSQSPSMPAFARLVSLSTPESAKWAKEHPQQMTDLDNWVKSTDRGF